MVGKWRIDGVAGDKIIRHRGKLYRLATVRDARSYNEKARVKRAAQKWAGRDGVVLSLSNTYSYAVYLPYSGVEKPKRR